MLLALKCQYFKAYTAPIQIGPMCFLLLCYVYTHCYKRWLVILNIAKIICAGNASKLRLQAALKSTVHSFFFSPSWLPQKLHPPAV